MIHPDLANDDEEKAFRNTIMVEVNDAFSIGDRGALIALLEECENPPKDRNGKPNLRIAILKRKIKQIEKRLIEIQRQLIALRAGHLYRLRKELLEQEKAGVDLLGKMTQEISEKIAQRRSVLEKLIEKLSENMGHASR